MRRVLYSFILSRALSPADEDGYQRRGDFLVVVEMQAPYVSCSLAE